MRTREIPMIPRAGSEAMAEYNRREELKARRRAVKPIRQPSRSEAKSVSISKVLASSGIASGEVVRVSGGGIAEEKKPTGMSEVEKRLSDYLGSAEAVVNPPIETKEEPKEEETAEGFKLKSEGVETEEVKEVKVPSLRKRRRPKKTIEENETFEAKEEELTL